MAATNLPRYPEWLPGLEVDHVGAAISHLRAAFPEASINPSSVEATLLESLAVLLGPVTYAFQRVPASVLEQYMGLYGLYRHQGLRSKGRAQFRVTTAVPRVTIPSGTLLRYNLSDQSATLEYATTEEITIITADSVVGEAHIEATENGTSHNGLTAGSRLDMVNYGISIEEVRLSRTTSGGEDVESDDSFEERAMAMLARQTSALVYADQFGSAALTREEVGRVTVLDNYNAAAKAHAVGHVTVAATDTGGMDLDALSMAELQVWLRDQALASLVVHVIKPTYTPVNVTVTVEAAPATNYAFVEDSVINELKKRLDPLRWNWWETITHFDLATWIDDVAGVARVIDVAGAAVHTHPDTGVITLVTQDNGSVVLPGPAPLPLPGSFDITVTEPSR